MGHHATQNVSSYDEDFYDWTQRQAKLLRGLEDRADLPKDLDIDHLAEEIEDLGKAELRSVTSLIRQIFIHLIKAASEPSSRATAHWRAEALAFQADIPGYYAASMRQLIDLDSIWRKARKLADAQMEEGRRHPAGLPAGCPYTVDEMIAEDFDFDAALARLRTSPSSA